MSREIDERVVQMKFESGQFEKNIQTSIHSLEELKKGMDFQDAAKGFSKIDNAAKSVNVDPITRSIQQLNSHFNLLGITALNVMNRISNAAINTGEKLLKSLTIDQVTPGWDKYEQKTSSVQTIMAATAKQFGDTGKQMEVVNEQLDKLNWFTDETSYNFVDMVNNIGKFTSNNIDLKTSVTSMQGIATWAAKSGANANEASRAMYNLAQALAVGSVKLIDWKSIENANMATTEFKQTAIDTAVELGTLTKVGDGLYKTWKGNEVSVSNFNEALSDAWFSSEVLLKSLDKYGAATNLLNEITGKYDMTASSLIKDIEKYTDSLAKATAESKSWGLSEEETQKKIKESVSDTATEIAESWGASVEETIGYLDQFQEETMQFGLSAFKAAQEAKTFTEAIASVRDAVSTGWMKSFELIFGDYMQAKEFWTNIANTLYDIFAEGANARNAMLEDWAAKGGQKYFTDAIYAGLAAILSILSPIKAAWNSVFGSISADQLFNLTKGLRDFLVRLSASEATMQKIARVFRGLFSVLDLIRTVIGELVSGALQGFQRIMAELGIDVGEFAASAGDVVYYLTQWIKQTGIVRKLMNLLTDAIIAGIRNIRNFVNAFSSWAPAKNALEKFKKIGVAAFGALGSAIYVLIDVLHWLFQQFQNFHLPTSFDEVWQFFANFAAKVEESFQKIGISTGTLGTGFGVLGTIIKNTIGTIVGIFAAASQGVVSSVELINRSIAKVDWSGILLAAFGVATIALLWKFATALNTLAASIKNVTQVGAKVGGAFDAIQKYFTALKDNIQTNNILKTAIAITALAVACGILARMDWKNVLAGGGAILMIAGAVTVLTLAFDKWSTKHGAMNGKGMLAMTQFVLALAASMVAITFALNNLRIDEELGKRLVVLGGVLITFSATAAIFSIVAKPIQVGALNLVGIAASVLLMLSALKRIKPEDAPAILSMLPVVSALMLVMAGLTKLMTTTKKTVLVSGNMVSSVKSGSGILSIIGLVAGLHLMIAAIKTLAKMDPNDAAKGIILMIPVLVLVKSLLKHVGLASKEAKSAGKMVMYIAVAVNLLYFAIKNLAKLNLQEITQGGIIVTALMGLSLLLVKFSSGAGKYAAKAGLMILEIAGALAIIQLVIKTLGRLDLATALKGTASVTVILLAIGEMLKGMEKHLTADANGLKALINITIIVGMISALVIALTWMDPVGALAVSAGLALLFISLGKAVDSLKFTDDIKMDSVGKVLVFVGVLGAIIGLLGKYTDWKGALAIAGGMSLIFVALGAMMKIANKSSGGLTKAKLAPMAAIVLELGVIVGALALLSAKIKESGGMDYGTFWSLVGGLTAIMTAYGLMTGIMGSMKGKPTKDNILPLLAIIGVLTAVIGALALMSAGLNIDWAEMLAMTTGMSEIMLAFGLMTRLIDGVKIPENLSSIQRLAIVVGAITAVMAIIAGFASYYGADLSDTLTLASSMSLLLLALSAAARIMNGKTFKMDLGTIATLGVLVAGLGGILALFNTWITNPDNLLPFALAMVPLLVGVSASAVILGYFPKGGSGALEGIAVVLAIIAGMGAIIAALGGLNELTGGKIASFLEDGAKMMISLGEGIGGFVGGLIGGFAGGLTSGFEVAATMISNAMTALYPFFDGLEYMPKDILDLGKRLVDSITLIANPSFKLTLKSLKDVAQAMSANGDNLDTIFETFGHALKVFSDASYGINVESVTNAIEAATNLSKLEAGLPKKGGLLQTVLGEDDLASFGERLRALGYALYTFAYYGTLIDSSGMKTAVSASEKLRELESKLPAKDGVLQAFFGQDGFDKFGSRLETYGAALVAFSDSVSGKNGGNGIDTAAIDTAIIATKQLSDIESGLTSSGSVIGGFFFGNSDLGTFGERLSSYGTALVGFCVAIAGKISLSDIDDAVTATSKLSDLEGDLETHGGWDAFWNGDNTFDKFGKNLEGFGNALANFASKTSEIDWRGVWRAVDFIEDLTKVDKVEEAANKTVTAAKTLMANVINVINEHKQSIKDEAHDMAYWLADGLATGMIDYEQYILNTAAALATKIINIMNSVFQIHSPSVVMNKMGHWVVKGLGEGITEDMSAEEAAEKKAENIISAFQNGFNKINTKLDITNLEYELWTRTEGKNASESDKLGKQLELEVEKLKTKAKEVSMMRTAMNAVIETAGKDSEAYMTAYKNYLQAQNDMYDQQAAVEELQASNLKTSNESYVEQYRQFIEIQNKNAELFKSLGYTDKEIREFAADQVSADFGRKIRIAEILNEQKAAFDELGYTMEQRTAEAEKMLGVTTKSSVYDTAAIIEEAMADTSYTLEEAVSNSLSGAVSRGGSSSAVSSAIGGVSDNIVGSLQESISNALSGMDFDFEATGWGKLEDMLGVFNDPSTITSQISNFFGGDNGVLGAIKRETQPVTDAVSSWANGLVDSIFGEGKAQEWKDGAKKWLGDDGVKGGLEDKEALESIEESGANVVKTATDSMEEYHDNGKDGTISYDIGEHASEEFAAGEIDKDALSDVEKNSKKVVDKASSEFSESVTLYRPFGQEVSKGFALGILDREDNVVSAAQRVAEAANTAFHQTLKVESPSKVTRQIGRFVSEGLAIGIVDQKSMVINSAEEVANSTISAFDYSKNVINDLLASDDDFAPTITPVLDLDALTQEAKSIPNLLNRNTNLNLSATARRANMIQADLTQTDQNGSNAPNQTNYNFTQNNYSPKSLNRTEIYRQTQNQFAQLKGATKIR